ncbi:MAG TPA: PE-PPE domain-containing protein, partial [Mycobacterium sp.]|nr:PE-PPE domain-containing protein [Mycobacterium sp.]
YDGFADFPQYPIDFLSDVNALLGIIYQHATYADLIPQQVDSAIALPTVGDTLTRYYMIPAENLPLLDPLRLIPLLGNPSADLLQPDVTVLVNLGYGSITEGWSQGPANVATPFGAFPSNINPAAVLTALAHGARQGITDAIKDLMTPTVFDTSSLAGLVAAAHTLGLTTSTNPSLLELVAALSTFGNGDVPASSTGIVDTLTSAVANAYSVLLPTADIGLVLAVTLPGYGVSLFVNQLKAGKVLTAIVDPIAADVALGTVFVALDGVVFAEAAATTVTELAGLGRTPASAASRIGANGGPGGATRNTARIVVGTGMAGDAPALGRRKTAATKGGGTGTHRAHG